jgi:hypothetical protein
MNNLRCLLGLHRKNLIMKQITKEVDTNSGVFLTRNVYHCEDCKKDFYKRTDGVIGISDKNWTWKNEDWFTTDYYL